MRVVRADFLSTLEAVSPGLAKDSLLEQADCFVFKNGKVHTFNDEAACASPSGLDKSFAGAVVAKPLLELLRRIPDDELEVSIKENGFHVRGKGGRRGEIRCESDILLGVDSVEVPKEWTPLPEDFAEAVDLVQSCAIRDGEITQVCLHITPKHIEACDDVQLCRYKIKTGVKEKVLIRKESIRHIVQLGMSEFSEGKDWFHFRNPDKMQLSCRRYLEEYPDWSEFLNVEGEKVTMPKGLDESLDRASILLDETEEDAKRVRVVLLPGKLRVIGEGVNGRWTEFKKTQYTGRQLSFLASPKMLTEIAKRYNECEATEDRLKVDGGKWRFVACLDKVSANGEANGHAESEE